MTSLAALGDPTRRCMFELIRQERRPVTREEAAHSLGISHRLAAFHLDKLVEASLLQARYESPAGIRKVGRRPKVYEPVDEAIAVHIPSVATACWPTSSPRPYSPRRTRNRPATPRSAWRTREGKAWAVPNASGVRPGRLGAERGLSVAAETLEKFGFEPERAAPTLLRLRNCPFHPMAAKAPELVCAVNQAFLAGYLHGLGSDKTTAVLAPQPGSCCVELRGDGATGRSSQTDTACEA
ncbi:helix-turn-helix transcriptional regulator [Streptomyces sp. NPDC003247]|uniref:helix-turn-helix transcriptional regulator n=1 Tax=Streptomyces sp. NPDC003247 TaxID=3364677 RepID=UPI00368B028E